MRPIWPVCIVGLLLGPVAAQGVDLQTEQRSEDVLFLGEVHDNPLHHQMQAALIATLSPSAIVFEMLTPSEAELVTPDLVQDPERLAEVLDWDNSGWPDFDLYAPLLAFAAEVPIYGAEVPRAEAQRAFEAGAAAVFGPEAAVFGLDVALPAEQQAAREALQLAAHCDALPEELLPGFVEAQRLRDARIAASALAAFDVHGGPVVVITGNGHARRDWGAPALIALAAPSMRVWSLGMVEGAASDWAPVFDAVYAVPAIDRPDPCAAFR